MRLPEQEVCNGLRGGAWATEAVTDEGQAPLSESRADGDDVVTEYLFISYFVFPAYVEGVSEEAVVGTVESLCQGLVHRPGGGIVEQDRLDEGRE